MQSQWFGMRRIWVVISALLLIGGCSMAPPYRKPEIHLPDHFKEERSSDAGRAAPADFGLGAWQPAQPSEHLERGEWWKVFHDSRLDDYEQQALHNNPGLQAALARVKESRAILQKARSALFPEVSAGFGPSREKLSAVSQLRPDGVEIPTQDVWRAQASASYEVDLFGRVSDSVKASAAEAEQSEALFRSVRLALQADVAQSYFNLRELDAELDVYNRSVELRGQALSLVQHRFDEGEISELDVRRAESELATARSDAMTAERMRAVSEHSLAVLLGKIVADFTVERDPLVSIDVRIPPGLPSSMLERRPDVAAAERAMAAANARVGMAKAAFFPSLNLTGSAGFESASLSDLFKWSSRAFLLGPFVGTALTAPVFDGGRRKGELARARATYEANVDDYRQLVLVAFREVEDNVSELAILQNQTLTQAEAVSASTRAAQLSRTQYQEGAVNFLDVIDADRTVLQSQRAAAQLAGLQAVATVNLVRALGGGWSTEPALANTHD
jgi:multidrug efflux system outer membrane protein